MSAVTSPSSRGLAVRLTSVMAAAIAVAACGSLFGVSCGLPPNTTETSPVTASSPATATPAAGPAKFKIVFLGDSLTAGLGLLSDQAFPALIQKKFSDEGYSLVEAVNAGMSGDTSAGGLRRVDDVLEPDTRILVVALGGNDALRGLTTAHTHDNIAAIIDDALGKGVAVMLAGMEAPTNLGADYRDAFHGAFIQLARAYRGRVTYVPFLLEGVAANPALNQADGIHPNERGAQILAEHLYPLLRTMVDQIGGGG